MSGLPLRKWLEILSRSARRGRPAARREPVRPHLEQLERRVVPAGLPFVVYFFFRRHSQIWRGFDLLSPDEWLTSERSATFAHRLDVDAAPGPHRLIGHRRTRLRYHRSPGRTRTAPCG